MTDRIILASKSPRRMKLLEIFDIPFEVVTVDATEIIYKTPLETATRNAENKARICQSGHPNRLILSADTVVSLENLQIGKPKDFVDAYSILSTLSGKTHQVTTAVTLAGPNFFQTKAEESLVTFKKLSDQDIESYIASVDVMDKAGAYGIQEKGWMIVTKVDGSFDNVIGLPLVAVFKLLVLAQTQCLF